MGFIFCFILDFLTLEDEDTMSIVKVRNHTQHHIPENMNLASSCHKFHIPFLMYG